MTRLKIGLFSAFLFCGVTLSAQAVSEEGYFLVTPEKFTPPIQALIANFEGKPAEPFLANDILGEEHYLNNYRGDKVLLWFWTTESPLAVSQLDALNQLQLSSKVKVLSLAKETKEELLAFNSRKDIQFPVIPNADIFGQMAYGADLGYPRFFIIDTHGIIRAVLPQEAFAGEGNIAPILEGILGGIN